MSEICGDDRFDLIDKAKAKLLEATNIEMCPAEMAVLDSILFRCWQMGWLDKLRVEERIRALESENAKLREADAVNDLALSYVAIKADRDACKKLLESYMTENDVLYMENIKLECRVSELEELVRESCSAQKM